MSVRENPQCKSNSNLSQAQQLITGFIMHLFYKMKLASFCKKSSADVFAMPDLHNKKRYSAPMSIMAHIHAANMMNS